MSSPKKHESTSKEREALSVKLKSINDKLHKIQDERKKMSPMSKYTVSSKSTATTSTKRLKKRALYHPRLDLIIAENCYSPYLTRPTEKYSPKTLHVPLQVKELRFAGSSASAEGFPVEMKKAKEIFIKEIIEYKAHFEFHEEKTNLPMQYINDPPELFIPGVHDKPRESSKVHYNEYEPLKGHTGKLPNLVNFLRNDPNRPKTSPPLLTRQPSLEDCTKLLEDLEAHRPGTSPAGQKPALLRQGSGTLQAHAGRGGPDQYRKEIQYRKAVQELRRVISSRSFDDGSVVPMNGGKEGREEGDDDDDNYTDCGFDDDDDDKEQNAGHPQHSVRMSDNRVLKSDGIASSRDQKISEPKPEWDFDGLAVLRIRKVVTKNLKSDYVFGKKTVFASLKYGKMWNAKTKPVDNAPNICDWVIPDGNKSMAYSITSESVKSLRLGVSVFNLNKVRADTLYGSCKLDIYDELAKNKFEAESTISCDLTNKTGVKTGKVIVVFDVIRKDVFDAIVNTDEDENETEEETAKIDSEAKSKSPHPNKKSTKKNTSAGAVNELKPIPKPSAKPNRISAVAESKTSAKSIITKEKKTSNASKTRITSEASNKTSSKTSSKTNGTTKIDDKVSESKDRDNDGDDEDEVNYGDDFDEDAKSDAKGNGLDAKESTVLSAVKSDEAAYDDDDVYGEDFDDSKSDVKVTSSSLLDAKESVLDPTAAFSMGGELDNGEDEYGESFDDVSATSPMKQKSSESGVGQVDLSPSEEEDEMLMMGGLRSEEPEPGGKSGEELDGCLGGDLENSVDDDKRRQEVSGKSDLHEPSVFYDLSADEGDGLIGLDVMSPDKQGAIDGSSKVQEDEKGILGVNAASSNNNNKKKESAPSALPDGDGDYDDEDFIYDDEDDEGSYVSAEIQRK